MFNSQAQSLLCSPMTYSLFEYAKEQAVGLLEIETTESVSEMCTMAARVM